MFVVLLCCFVFLFLRCERGCGEHTSKVSWFVENSTVVIEELEEPAAAATPLLALPDA